MTKRSSSLFLLSPASLLFLSWAFMLAGVMYGYVERDNLPVLVRTMQLNKIYFVFPPNGFVWIGICLLAVLSFGLPATKSVCQTAKVIAHPSDLSKAVRIAAIGHAFIMVVVTFWILIGANSVGGITRLIALAAEQRTYEAKDVILNAKLFPGMRLLYTGLVCLGVFGACVFTANVRSNERIRTDMAIGIGMFLGSALALSILPVFLSQRILLVQMALSTFVGVSLVSGKILNFRYTLVLAGLLFTVWSLREAVTVGQWASEFSAARVGAEKIIYYLVNDFYNAVAPFSLSFDKTYGYYSFTAVLYFSGTENMFFSAFEDRISLTGQLLAGGVYPAFTAHYVDFAWAGIFMIILLVVLFTWIFNQAQRSFTFCVVYGLVGGALILTPHVAWYSHQNFVFNVLLTLLICSFIRRRVAFQPVQPRA